MINDNIQVGSEPDDGPQSTPGGGDPGPRPGVVSRLFPVTFGGQLVLMTAVFVLGALGALGWSMADGSWADGSWADGSMADGSWADGSGALNAWKVRIGESPLAAAAVALLGCAVALLAYLRPRVRTLEEAAHFAGELECRYGASMPVPEGMAEFTRLGESLNRASRRLRDQEVDIMSKAAQLRAENKFVNALLGASGALVVVYDAAGRIVTFNRACEKTTGYRADEVKGRSVYDLLIDNRDAPHIHRALESVRGSALVGRAEYGWLTKDGKRRIVSWSNSVLSDEKKKARHLVAVGIDVTEQRLAEEALERNQRNLLNAQRLTALGNWDWNLSSRQMTCSAEVFRILGIKPGDYAPSFETFLQTIHPDDRRLAQVALDKCLAKRQSYSFEHRIVRPDGDVRYVHQQGETVCDENGRPRHLIGTVLDITDRKNAEEQLKLARKVVENTTEAILITDANTRIVDVNAAFVRMTGYTKEEVVGQNPQILKSDRQDDAFYDKLWTEVKNTGWWSGEIWDRRKNGEEFPKWLSISAVNDERGQVANYVAIFTDISKAKEAEAQLRQLAHFDTLTGLPNRALFFDRLQKEIDRAKRYNRIMAVLFIDLDRFKHVNDTLGHSAGDALLRTIGERLVKCTRKPDTVARLGGDEFTVILTEVPENGYVEAIAQRVVAELSKAVSVLGNEVFVSASVGIALYPSDGEDGEALMKCADTAMYYAKDKGKNTYQFFDAEMNGRAFARLKMEGALRRALRLNELTLNYQPKMNLANGKIVGTEALLRWHSPEIGNVPPATFIPVAEETGLIIPIGRYVLSEACRQAKAWSDDALLTVPVSVNLSAREFKDQSLIRDIRSILDDTGLDASLLEIEVTETLVMDDLPTSIEVMQGLKDMGVHLAVDDFGTGYSSLSYLKRLPVDTLKIDRSFISDVTDHPDDTAIVTAIISMAHNLNMTVIAEGVETRAQLQFLRNEGCHQAQGYLISRPVAADRMGDALRQASRLMAANAA